MSTSTSRLPVSPRTISYRGQEARCSTPQLFILAHDSSRVSPLRVQNGLSAVRASLRALRVKHPVLNDGGGYGIVSILMVLTDVDTQIRDCYCFLN